MLLGRLSAIKEDGEGFSKPARMEKMFTVVSVIQIRHKRHNRSVGTSVLSARSENLMGSRPSEPGFPHPCSGTSASSHSKGIELRLTSCVWLLRPWIPAPVYRGGLKPQRAPKRSEDPAGKGLSLKDLKSSGIVLFFLFGNNCKGIFFSAGELVLVFLVLCRVLRRKQKWG